MAGVNPESELGHAHTDKKGRRWPPEETGLETPNEFRIQPQQRNTNSQSKKGRTDTCGLPGTTATQSLQPCSFSSPMSGRTWTATLTQQSSPCSMVIVPTDDHTISNHFLSFSLSLNASSTKNRDGNKTGEDRKRRSEAKD